MSKPLYKTIFKFSHNWTDTIFSSVPYVNGYKKEREREREKERETFILLIISKKTFKVQLAEVA